MGSNLTAIEKNAFYLARYTLACDTWRKVCEDDKTNITMDEMKAVINEWDDKEYYLNNEFFLMYALHYMNRFGSDDVFDK